MDLKTIAKKELSIDLTPKQLEHFEIYKEELLEWNEKINLTAIRLPGDIDTKHFLDSLTVLPFIPKGTRTLADIGTGAGFPGMPLAIMKPEVDVTLIESIGKKCRFLEHIKETLDLKNVEVVNARAEEVGEHRDYFQKFDIVTARAVTKIEDLVLYAFPLLKKNGLLLAQKGTKEDIEAQRDFIKQSGGEILDIQNTETESLKERRVVIIKKK